MILEFAKEKRGELPKECERIRTEDIAGLRRQADIYESLISKLQSDSAESENKLNEERTFLISEINKTYDKKISENRKCTAATIQQYNERKEKLQQKLQYLDKMTNALGTECNTFTDHDLIEMMQEMMTELENAKSYNAEKYSHCNGFVQSKINIETISGITGELHNISIEETSTFKKFSSPVWAISPRSEDEAWIRETESRTVKLFTENGERLRRLSTDCTSLTVLQNGHIARTSGRDRVIAVMNDNGEEIMTLGTEPLLPIRISKTELNDILVTLIDGGDHYNLLPTSRRIVQLMTLTGKMLQTYEFKEDGETRLFICPSKTAENKNTDVCVINRTSSTSSHLVVLYRDGRVKFTYRGQNVTPDKFCSLDLACDSKCCIIISEFSSHLLHLLSSEGQIIGCIPTFSVESLAIALSGEKLWVGSYDGEVKVYRYKSV